MRITPACAGKSPSHLTRRITQRDHPRMCGEKHKLPAGKVQDAGITPACAGKSKAWERVQMEK